MGKIKKFARIFLRKTPKLRKLVRKVYDRIKESNYRKITKGIETDKKMILFETFMGRQYGCNPKAIYEYILKDHRFDDYKLVWAFIDVEKAETIPELERAETVRMLTKEYFQACAKAGYIVTNANLNNRIIKKDDQVFIQTWHGTPLKKLRCDIDVEGGNANNTLEDIKRKNDVDVIRYDYFVSPSPFCTEKFASAFNLTAMGHENVLVETGYPRNDILINHSREDASAMKGKLGIPEDRKVILYAPTFRDNQHDGTGYTYDTHIDFDRMREELGEDYVILFRAHYFVANQFDFARYEGFVYDMSGLDDISGLYLIADVLITDYSSVFFDFANLERPMLFYMYDLEEYGNDIRGFYFDIDEIPGPKLRTEDSLIEAIRNLDSWEPDDKYRAFNKKFNPLEDGKASRRVAEIILK